MAKSTTLQEKPLEVQFGSQAILGHTLPPKCLCFGTLEVQKNQDEKITYELQITSGAKQGRCYTSKDTAKIKLIYEKS
jgi:hypothetical protein